MSLSPTETLNPTQPLAEAVDGILPADIEMDAANNPGEKRKRDDPEPEPKPDSSVHPLWKTSLCSYFRKAGTCRHGDGCRYAHGEEELRIRPDKSWDPTSERAKKAQKLENGDKCEVKEDEDVMMTEMLEDGDGSEDSGLRKCLVNLPRKWTSDQLKSFLSDNGIVCKSAKKKRGMTVGFVNFENGEQLKTAVEELEGKSIGNKNLKVADVVARSFDKTIKLAMAADDAVVSGKGMDDGDTNDGSLGQDGSVSKARSARDVVTPLAHLSYSDQLDHKKNSIAQMLKKLTRNARKACPNGVSLPEWIMKSREIGGLPCKLEGILGSPLENGYRNKCEFSVGYSLQGKPTVGFMLGNFREGVTAVEEPVDCPNVSKISCKYAAIFQEFLQHLELPIWNRFKNTGFWRQLTVREGRTSEKAIEAENLEANISEVMLMIQVSSAGFDDTLVNNEFERLSKAFTEGAAANCPTLPLTALVVQEHQGISNVAPADAPLRQLTIPKPESPELEGASDITEARIHDCISNLRFCISPTAFFQVNTLAAEKLYSLAGDWADLGPDTLLFDVCCGTGTIGLTLAHRVGMVIGIEMNASAVSDAYRNAEINGIKNCKFVCAKAEDVMGSLLREHVSVPQRQDEHAADISNKDSTASEEKDSSTDNIQDSKEASNHDLEKGSLDERANETTDKEITSCEEKDCSMDKAQDSKGASNHDSEDGMIAPECSESCEKELEKSGKSDDGDGKPSPQQFKNVVAIVDPPRGGLHPTVIKVLRTHSHLRRLVYISCNPETLVANAIELCTPSPPKVEKNKDNRGWRNMSSAGLARHRAKSMPASEPFQPVKAMAVDLFPHTSHCEMVMLLER